MADPVGWSHGTGPSSPPAWALYCPQALGDRNFYLKVGGGLPCAGQERDRGSADLNQRREKSLWAANLGEELPIGSKQRHDGEHKTKMATEK